MDQNGDYVSAVCVFMHVLLYTTLLLFCETHGMVCYTDVCLAPVISFSSPSRQAFVLGIQFDIGNKDASARKMKMIDGLFRALPDTVVANPDHLKSSRDTNDDSK